jgi:hypothetical protein
MTNGHGGARKGAGKPKGTTSELIKQNQAIVKEAGVVEFLVDALKSGVIEGKPLELNKRIDIAQFLANKFMPSQKAVEVTGESGGDIILKMVNYGDSKDE